VLEIHFCKPLSTITSIHEHPDLMGKICHHPHQRPQHLDSWYRQTPLFVCAVHADLCRLEVCLADSEAWSGYSIKCGEDYLPCYMLNRLLDRFSG
jgi:hypothetical protein